MLIVRVFATRGFDSETGTGEELLRYIVVESCSADGSLRLLHQQLGEVLEKEIQTFVTIVNKGEPAAITAAGDAVRKLRNCSEVKLADYPDLLINLRTYLREEFIAVCEDTDSQLASKYVSSHKTLRLIIHHWKKTWG